MSETESQTMDSEDDALTTSTHGSESPMTTDSEMETEEEEGEEENDSWMPMVEEVMQKHKAAFEEMKMNYILESGLNKQSADQKTYANILSKLQKELASIYLQRLQWIQQLKKDPVHKKIMQTKSALVNGDDFDPEEAMEAAVNKRKFLIKRRLKDYSFTED